MGAWVKESGLESTRAVSKGKCTQVYASGKCARCLRLQIPGEVNKSASEGIAGLVPLVTDTNRSSICSFGHESWGTRLVD